MSCSRNEWIIKRYIERVLNTSLVRKQDQERTLGYIGQQESNKYIAYTFATNNYEEIISRCVLLPLLFKFYHI